MLMVHELLQSTLFGRLNTDQEWTDYFQRFHEQLPNANDLFTFLKTRANDTSYTVLAKSINTAARSLLEIGCGDGNLVDDVLEELPHASIDGVDVSNAQIAIARGRYPREERARFHVADAKALPFEDKGFDCVLSHQFLNFLPDPQPYLREVARVLKSGGRLLAVCNASLQGAEAAQAWTSIHEAALAAVRTLYPAFVWPKMGDRRFYNEKGIREIFGQSHGFDVTTLSMGAFVGAVFLAPERVADMYNRLYFYATFSEKKVVQAAVLERARELSKSNVVELALPFRLISIRAT